MALYSWAMRTTLITAGSACVEINTPSTLGVKILEVGFSLVTAATCVVGLGKALAAAITQNTVTSPLPEQDSGLPTAKTTFCTAWGTAPTMPLVTSAYYRRASIVGAIGAGVIWTFPRGLYIPPSATGVGAPCLFNCTATTGFLDVWVVIDE
jgi:hypothetical protein